MDDATVRQMLSALTPAQLREQVRGNVPQFATVASTLLEELAASDPGLADEGMGAEDDDDLPALGSFAKVDQETETGSTADILRKRKRLATGGTFAAAAPSTPNLGTAKAEASAKKVQLEELQAKLDAQQPPSPQRSASASSDHTCMSSAFQIRVSRAWHGGGR